MAKGFHSRSPEELRVYLEGLNKKSKKRNWIQIFIFIDIVVILFAFYLVSKNVSPDFGSEFKPSNKIIINNSEIYFSKSNDSNEIEYSYFLFYKNLSIKEKTFPNPTGKLFLNLYNKDNEVCISKEVTLNSKKILGNTKEFFSFGLEEKEIPEKNDCKEFFKKADYKGMNNFFKKTKSKFYIELNMLNENQIYKMRIE